TAVRGVFTAAFDPAEGPGETAVGRSSHPVDPVGVVQAGQQDLMKLEPDASLLPGVQSAPARHAAATAHCEGEVLPGDAGLEDEKDASEGLSVVQGLAAGEAASAGLGRWQ